MKRTAVSTRNPTLHLLLIALTLSLSASACGKKNKAADAGPKVHEIKAVGVKVTAPSDWEVQKRGSRWIVRSGNLGVFFSKHPSKAPTTPKEAAALLSNFVRNFGKPINIYTVSKQKSRFFNTRNGFEVLSRQRTHRMPCVVTSKPAWQYYPLGQAL